MDFKEVIKTFICSELLEDEVPLEDEENLLADGMVDSMGMLRLMAFLEERYELKVPPEHFVIENFKNINAIDQYLTKHVGD